MDLNKIAHYEIKEKIGEGAASEVYLGFDTKLHRQTAIKILNPGQKNFDKIKGLFLKEAKIVAKLNHPNIVTVYDYSGDDSETLYLVMEFAENGSLSKYLKTKNIPEEVGIAITIGVLEAISHAKKSNILHLDVKPENILFSKDFRIKLTDFGIARIKEDEEAVLSTNVMGTPAYMSPEQIKGEGLDFRSDIFSIGVLLCELATGAHPFKGKNVTETLKNIADGKDLDSTLTDLSYEELSKIIKKATNVDISERYQELDSFIGDLKVILNNIGIHNPEKLVTDFFSNSKDIFPGLKQKRISYLTDIGKKELPQNKVKALDTFNKILKIDPENREILDILKKRSKAHRIIRIGIYLMVISLVAFFFYIVTEKKIHESSVSSVQVLRSEKKAEQEPPIRKSGFLKIVTRPWAKVFIDNKLIGSTPLAEKLELSEGAHKLKLENPGCRTHEEEVIIKRGETSFSRVELEIKKARLIFDLEKGVTAFVDENKILDKKSLEVNYGKHTVSLFEDDEKIHEISIDLKPGEKQVIKWPAY